MKIITILLLYSSLSMSNARIALKKLSSIYLPFDYDGEEMGSTALGKASAEQLAYDAVNQIAYVVGGSVLHAVDLRKPEKPITLAFRQYADVDLTDIVCCGDNLFITVDDLTDKFAGRVKVLSKYQPRTCGIPELFEIQVGVGPDSIVSNSDCSKLVVAVEAEAFEQPDQTLVDPPASVTIINFPGGDVDEESLEKISLDFQEFDSKVEDLRMSGVRFVYQENDNLFSNDVEPESVSLSQDENTAFVTLQENNAVARIDIRDGKEKIISIDGLGFKDWSKLTMDPSDKDGGAFLNSYPILGIYQPDGIKFFRWNDRDLLLMANEGDAKDYNSWTEEVRGKEIDAPILPTDLDDTTKDQLQQDDLLGRLKFSTSPAGTDDESSKLNALYSFGARGFSIREASDLSLVYDSDDEIGRITEYFKKPLFNTQVDEATNRPFQDFDTRSDDKGAETETVEVGELNGQTLLLIGNERPGVVFLYTIREGASQMPEPVLQDVYQSIPDKFGDTWEQQYNDGLLSEIDVEDIKFLGASESPTGNPAVLVTGAFTGTLSVLEVDPNAPGDSLEDVQECAASTP